MEPIQQKMFAEIVEKTIFRKAEKFAFEYLDSVFDREVNPTDIALKNLEKFDEKFPEQIGNAEQIIDMLHAYGSPATITQTGGRYFGFVNGGVIPAGLAAKNLSIFWDQNSGLQVISPVCSKLEMVVEKWLKQIFGLPDETVAGFVSGTSMANFCGLVAARYRILINQGWDVTEKGLFDAPKIRVVACTQAHSTVLKTISLAGLGKSNIEWVDVDDQGRIIPEQIPELDERTILFLKAGNVNSGAFDDFHEICGKAKSQQAWIHIDGAFGLWAAATSRLKHLTKGYELADSFAVDGHKTLNTPYDSGIILCKDKKALVSALHMTGAYIVESRDRDGMYFTPEMSRRARIVELWATLKYLGKEGIDQLVYGLHKRALQFAYLLSQIEGFEIINDVVFNQVMVRCANDELTIKTISKIQNMRECWVGPSTWQNRKVIRISVCSWATTEEDVRRSVNSFRIALDKVKEELV